MSHATFASMSANRPRGHSAPSRRGFVSEQSEQSAPRVSVLMPVYNGEKYLEEAVESILAQTFDDFEFLIMDDGSTDRTGEILDRLAAKDARIRVFHRENRGITPTLNELLRLARADLVARMDDDDIAFPERFATQVRHLDENPDCALVASSVVLIDPEGRDLATRAVPLSHEEIVEGLLRGGGQFVFHPATMFRRKPTLELGGYQERHPLAQDLDLFLRLAEVGRLTNLPQPLLKYRDHLGKLGVTHSRLQGETVRRILSEAHQRRGTTPPDSVLNLRFEPRDRAEKHRIWGWWALGSGRVATARKHAFAAFWRRPISGASWKLLACAIRGR